MKGIGYTPDYDLYNVMRVSVQSHEGNRLGKCSVLPKVGEPRTRGHGFKVKGGGGWVKI